MKSITILTILFLAGCSINSGESTTSPLATSGNISILNSSGTESIQGKIENNTSPSSNKLINIDKQINHEKISLLYEGYSKINNITTLTISEESCLEYEKNTSNQGFIFIPMQKLKGPSNLQGLVRENKLGIDKNLINIGGRGSGENNKGELLFSGMHILEIFDNEGNILTSINGSECTFPGQFRIIDLGSKRLLILISAGHESGPMYFYYDGEKRNDFYQLLQDQGVLKKGGFHPLEIKVDHTNIYATEIGYASDTPQWLYGENKRVTFIFDLKTMKFIKQEINDIKKE